MVTIRLLLAVLLLSALGCSQPKIHSEFADGAVVSGLRSYAWITDDLILIKAGEGRPELRTERNEKRIRNAVDLALEGKGYEKSEHEAADFFVAFSFGAKVRYRLEGADGQFGMITDNEAAHKQTKGTLTIYVFDRASANELWRGWTSKWLRDEGEPDSVINEAARRVLDSMPNAAGP